MVPGSIVWMCVCTDVMGIFCITMPVGPNVLLLAVCWWESQNRHGIE